MPESKHDKKSDGASSNERLLLAARTDHLDMLVDLFEDKDLDINFQDGLGNTALHYAASNGSVNVIEDILMHPQCDVDPINRLERATPLHLAVKLKEDREAMLFIVDELLDAGANMAIKDKNGDTALDLVPKNDTEVRTLFQRAQAELAISADDIASDEDEGGPGSGSDE
ncbi:hypothetical protein SERLA73DRAFT_174532 [Serpula lacrymans var. lacrymans S7.3]|uniref:Uncharacterized protein n=2 Tax=Serpula lacrymans var. lacrymans TaxID=341189 RepID=F8PGF9_SERL3|nr:uncharacterized protein SERLADRAFT_456108 [Serpula lacrymans var. lacrymans S7.9]EGO05392.1 hypothetical protein SERLA73DRAFT_174532 [Serpula lacrymans var. lacrymans S7.3]EGO31242.1 hypothetical protein SERLADRAFT_456108 [Serpula lacrymans var. lacrymans S7.9]